MVSWRFDLLHVGLAMLLVSLFCSGRGLVVFYIKVPVAHTACKHVHVLSDVSSPASIAEFAAALLEQIADLIECLLKTRCNAL